MFETFGPLVSNIGAVGLKPTFGPFFKGNPKHGQNVSYSNRPRTIRQARMQCGRIKLKITFSFASALTFYYLCTQQNPNKMMETRITSPRITELKPGEIFVFGSNLEGAHGGGAALLAWKKWGAVWGQGAGLQGQTYGIPTMHGGPDAIKPYVDDFIRFAREHPELTFLVTEIGCGIAGFRPEEIAPLFKDAVGVANIHLPQRFWEVLNAK